MFFSAFVVFREIFEIMLITGIIIGATNNMKNKKKAISLGFIAGIIGSIIFAMLTDKITDFAGGLGQEITSAIILFIAAFFISWTLLWMQAHAKELKTNFNNISQEINKGEKTYFILSLIIALTILREGAEIILFTYGMIASGEAIHNIIIGSIIGCVAGLLIGLLMYFSLVRIPLRYFFKVTTILLTFLVAGMFSHALGYLTSAGYLNELSNVVWNSSHIISNDSVIGLFLETLFGYNANPNLAQLSGYCFVLFSFSCYFKQDFIVKSLRKVKILS